MEESVQMLQGLNEVCHWQWCLQLTVMKKPPAMYMLRVTEPPGGKGNQVPCTNPDKWAWAFLEYIFFWPEVSWRPGKSEFLINHLQHSLQLYHLQLKGSLALCPACSSSSQSEAGAVGRAGPWAEGQDFSCLSHSPQWWQTEEGLQS